MANRRLAPALTLCLLTGACAEPPPPHSATSPWLSRDVGDPSQVTTQPGAGDGYRIIACSPKSGVIGVIGTGSFPVPSEYPLSYNVSQHLAAALGPSALGVTYGLSCDKEDEGRHALSVLVLSYSDVDEAARKTAAFVRENDLNVHCTIGLAPDSTLKDDSWRMKPMSRDVGTLADIHTQPGPYDGYRVRRCAQYGLLGLEGTGHDPLPKGQSPLAALHREIEALMKPAAVGVGFGLGCERGDVGFRIHVQHVRDVDPAIARAGAILREKDLAAKMTVHLVAEVTPLAAPSN
ncbi:MAG TPA: hypothetical protein VE093_10855 [Polyangiaceae bacterium]|nr:hypothetical protein [Polyangiaceae bacterium]